MTKVTETKKPWAIIKELSRTSQLVRQLNNPEDRAFVAWEGLDHALTAHSPGEPLKTIDEALHFGSTHMRVQTYESHDAHDVPYLRLKIGITHGKMSAEIKPAYSWPVYSDFHGKINAISQGDLKLQRRILVAVAHTPEKLYTEWHLNRTRRKYGVIALKNNE